MTQPRTGQEEMGPDHGVQARASGLHLGTELVLQQY